MEQMMICDHKSTLGICTITKCEYFGVHEKDVSCVVKGYCGGDCIPYEPAPSINQIEAENLPLECGGQLPEQPAQPEIILSDEEFAELSNKYCKEHKNYFPVGGQLRDELNRKFQAAHTAQYIFTELEKPCPHNMVIPNVFRKKRDCGECFATLKYQLGVK